MSFHFFDISPASVAGGSREVGFAGGAAAAHLQGQLDAKY